MYNIDVIIPAHEKDLDTLDLCIENVKKYVENVKNVYVISKDKLTNNAIWHPESELPFSIESVGKKIGYHRRTAWYYADLLEAHAATLIKGLADFVLILDSDTIFTKHVNLIDEQGRCLLNSSPTDGLPSYYEWIDRLMNGLGKQSSESGITHFILQKKSIVSEIVNSVEKKYNKPFWEAALDITNQNYKNINDNNHATGQGKMAGFELYFTYALKHHPDKTKIRKLKSVLAYKGHIGVEGYNGKWKSRTNNAGNVWLLTEEEKKNLNFNSVKESIVEISKILGRKGWDVVTFQNHTRIGSDKNKKINENYIRRLNEKS